MALMVSAIAGVVGIMDKLEWITFLTLGLVLALVGSASTDWPVTIEYELITSQDLIYHQETVDIALEERLKICDEDEEVPLIVLFGEGKRKDLPEFDEKYSYNLINGVAGSAKPSAVRRLMVDESVKGVYLDGAVQVAQPINFTQDNRTVCPAEKINVKPLWDRGIDGSGVVVAILDSGIDENHPDLAGKVIGEVNFVDSERTTDDLLGHGTAVAGIIAGSGTASGGLYKGAAPGASLLNVRVIDSTGAGQISDIIAGIEWALENDADVLSMSLGGLNLGERNPPISLAADNAMQAGTVTCVAAGNLDERLLFLMMVASSVCLGCVESPGDGVEVITVGATDCDDRIAVFSGSGPVRDGRSKPTLVSPGVNVISTVPLGLDSASKVDDYYAGASGTSLAAPMAAGVAVLLLQADPNLTPAGVKAALTRGAVKLNNSQGEEYEVYYQGAGLLDANRSYGVLEEETLCGALPDRWSAGRWVYGDFWFIGEEVMYGSLETGADRFQKKIYALAPGDVDWDSKFLFFTDKELKEVETLTSGPISDWVSLQPLPSQIPANGQRVFGASISVPENATPGLYQGSIDILEGDRQIFSLPLEVEVAAPIEIEKGRGTGKGDLEKNEWHYYYLDVPPSTDELRCSLKWENGSDLDLFMLAPTSEYYPAEQEDHLEWIHVTNPPSGRWMVAIHPRNITSEESYLLEVERPLLESTPKRWSLGSVLPGDSLEASFILNNGGPDLQNVSYSGVAEGLRQVNRTGSVEEKDVWNTWLDVPPNATRLGIKLIWDDPDTELALILFNPHGRPVDLSYGNENLEEVGASNPIPGKWQAWVYGYYVPGDQPRGFDLEANLYVQETWSWLTAQGPQTLESGGEGMVNATLTVPSDAPGYELEGYIRIGTENESFGIPVSLTVAGASLTGDSRSELTDQDGDGQFDELCVYVEVDVTLPGDYRLEGSLVDESGRATDWLTGSKLLEEDGSIEICLEGREIEDLECGSLTLSNLLLYNERGEIIDRYGEMVICPQERPQELRADSAPDELAVAPEEEGDVKNTKLEPVIIGGESGLTTP